MAGDAPGETGKILDLLGIGDLTAGAELFDHGDCESMTAGEGCRREPGDPGADDDEFEIPHARFSTMRRNAFTPRP
jgi:hypothetical protein